MDLSTVVKKSLRCAFLEQTVFSSVGMIPTLTVVLVIVFALIEPRFGNLSNLKNVIFQTSILALVSFGQFFAMLSGGIDFSVGAQLGLASIIGSLLMVKFGVFVGVLGALIGTALVGLVIGVVVAKFKANALIVSLGMYWVVMGLTYMISGGLVVYGLPKSFDAIGVSRIKGIPITALWALSAFLLCYFLLNMTVFGRHLYALGANERTARLSGISVDFIRILSYIICSLLVGFAGLILTAALGSGQPSLGADLSMQNFVVVFISGTRWGGGEGNIITVFFSVFFVAALANVLNIFNMSSYSQMVVNGLVLVAALTVGAIRRDGIPSFLIRK